jgi:hypothetical protein
MIRQEPQITQCGAPVYLAPIPNRASRAEVPSNPSVFSVSSVDVFAFILPPWR